LSFETGLWRPRALGHRRGTLTPGSMPIVMGIVNVTPDSVSDGGRYLDVATAVDHALKLLTDGAQVLDIGGESTRPGATRLDAAEEIARVVPVIRSLRERSDVVISIDTYKAEVAAAAIEVGADIINDISGFRFDTRMAHVAAASGAGAVLMHCPESLETRHEVDPDVDIVATVRAHLRAAVERAVDAGVDRARIAVDPGFGFGKSPAQNYELFATLDQIVGDGAPVLVGVSRKRMIRSIVGEESAMIEHGTSAASVLAAQAGASIVRVHDVAATVAALRVAHTLLRYRQREV
jgi:dihydropteroate synthase